MTVMKVMAVRSTTVCRMESYSSHSLVWNRKKGDPNPQISSKGDPFWNSAESRISFDLPTARFETVGLETLKQDVSICFGTQYHNTNQAGLCLVSEKRKQSTIENSILFISWWQAFPLLLLYHFQEQFDQPVLVCWLHPCRTFKSWVKVHWSNLNHPFLLLFIFGSSLQKSFDLHHDSSCSVGIVCICKTLSIN